MSSTHCPFCKGVVPEATVRFGGNCPHCMLEIPGEEAPTDPGLEARKKQEAEDRERALKRKKRSLVLGAVSLVVLAGLSAVGVHQWQQRQEAVTYEFDDYYQMPLSEIQGAPEGVPTGGPVAANASEAVARTGAPRRGGGAGGKPTLADPAIVTGTTAPDIVAPPEESGLKRASQTGGDAAVMPEDVSKAMGGGSQFGVGGITIERPTLESTLSDAAAIKDMAGRVINASSAQLQNCYNQRLKVAPELAGAWKLSFVITKDGTTRDVAVKGVNAEDAELEACMVRNVTAWRFTKIVRDQPVSKTYRFGAGNW